ncbi:MBL fold metallo-hydrolase [Rhodocaloribacter litoris]|uniref:MBL fold metallo-hydrolase n=1 Tax=Rhodocaloribacter litoris TaxID=2558931 RepID=UPI0014223EC2|nr:MBL fold metallo-hydrolase [Rhodocaloribacter litoris]QXD15473.1 MBL fold metallo-hydrolase [Rhodocaloribacter litoris]
MVFVALGATDEIGASCHFLKINGTGIVLDAGVHPEQEGPEGLPRLELIRQNPDWYVDHAIVTHAHHDHIGALPVLIRHFPHVHVHMTKATRQLADLLLPASARLQRRRLREGSSTAPPLFEEEELDVMSYLYLTHELETEFDVTGLRGKTPVKARFFNAGHVLGAAGVHLSFEEGGVTRKLFYTSDTSLRPQAILPGGSYPRGPIDVLILESTLGADSEAEQTTRKTEEKKFGAALRRVLQRGGAVLVPVFALGRGQEMLALIDRFKRRGIIPSEVPVYTAGSMRAIADLYDKTRFSTPRLDPDFQVFGVPQKRLPRSRQALRQALAEPSIYVVGSGMMFERTISNEIARMIVENEKDAIFLVGYTREDAPAGRLLEAAAQGKGTEVVLDKSREPQPVHCEVARFRFSGHSHRRDLIQLTGRLQPKKVLLVHGEDRARRWMADNLRFFYPEIEVVLPELGEAVPL